MNPVNHCNTTDISTTKSLKAILPFTCLLFDGAQNITSGRGAAGDNTRKWEINEACLLSFFGLTGLKGECLWPSPLSEGCLRSAGRGSNAGTVRVLPSGC